MRRRPAWRDALRWPGQAADPDAWDDDAARGIAGIDDWGPHDPHAGDKAGGGRVVEGRGVRFRWPGRSDASTAPAADGRDEAPPAPSDDGTPARRRWRSTLRLRMPRLGMPRLGMPRLRRPRVRIPRVRLPGLGWVRTLVGAVYGALAEPLVGGGAEARERRAAVVRRASRIAVGVALAAVLIYAIFPVRTYLDQRAATDRRHTQNEVLTEEIQRLEELKQRLEDDEEVIRIARRDYGLIFPGEDAYGILPAPEGRAPEGSGEDADTADDPDEDAGEDTPTSP